MAAPHTSTVTGAKVEHPRIAVIEDDPALQELFYSLLTDEGYDVVSARWAQGAHGMVLRERPAAILLDLRLEDPWAGGRLAEELQHDPETAAIPIIIVSADTPMLHERREALSRVARDIVEKPFNIAVLLETIARCIAA
jgi:DNA-binding response OmpR family regulator